MVQLSGPNSRTWKVAMVFMTFLKLYGLVSGLMAWKPRVQEVIRRVCQGPHRRVRAGSRQHIDVSTLEGVGPGRPPPSGPLHLQQMGVHTRVHRQGHEESDSQRPHRSKQSATGEAYVMGGYRDDDCNLDCPGLSMPLMSSLGDIFDGHRQQDDPASVPLLTPHAGGGLDPPPLSVVHGKSAFDRACKAVWGRAEWAIVLLLPSGPAPDADASPVPEVVRLDKVPNDPHVAVTSLREGGAVE